MRSYGTSEELVQEEVQGICMKKKEFLFQIKRLLKSLEGQKDARYYFAILNWHILNGTQDQHIYKLSAILLYLLCLIKQEILPRTPHNFLELGIKQFM